MNLFPEPPRDRLAQVNRAGVVFRTGLRKWVRRGRGLGRCICRMQGSRSRSRACLAFPLSLTAHVWEEGDHPVKERSFQKLYLA